MTYGPSPLREVFYYWRVRQIMDEAIIRYLQTYADSREEEKLTIQELHKRRHELFEKRKEVRKKWGLSKREAVRGSGPALVSFSINRAIAKVNEQIRHRMGSMYGHDSRRDDYQGASV